MNATDTAKKARPKMAVGVLIFERVPTWPGPGTYPLQVCGFGAPSLEAAIREADDKLAWLTKLRGREHHAAFHGFCRACAVTGKMPCNERCHAPKGFCTRRHPPCKTCGGRGILPLDETQTQETTTQGDNT